MKPGSVLFFTVLSIVCTVACIKKNDVSLSTPQYLSHSISLDEGLTNLNGFFNSISITKAKLDGNDFSVDTLRVNGLQTRDDTGLLPQDCDDLLYIVNFEGGGYALLAADDRIPDPIIAVVEAGSKTADELYSSYCNQFEDTHSTKGGIYQGSTFEVYDENEEDWYIGNYITGTNSTPVVSNFIDELVVGYVVEQVGGGHMQLPETPSIGDEGEITIQVTYTDLGTETVVDVLLDDYSSWTQEVSPYNDYTPNHYPAGCVNIALGKILAYFNGPTSITVNGVTLNWYVINHNPDSSQGRMYKGLLMYFLGVVCDSWYLPLGEGTFTLPIKAANYLSGAGYNNVTYSNYNTSSVKTALNNGCPVFVSGINRVGSMTPDIFHSHAWNIDGYKTKRTLQTTHYYLNGILTNTQTRVLTTTLVHCAFGWAGNYDGYFTSGIFQFSKGGSPRNYSIYLKTITYANPA